MRRFCRCLVLFILLSSWLSIASAQKVYWLEVGNRDNRIRCANLDGTNIEDIVTGLEGWPISMALDVADGKMYWTQNDPSWGDTNTKGKIRCANLDGSNVEDLVIGLGNMRAITLDVAVGKMYWTHWTQISKSPNRYRTKIQRANLDGTDIEDIVTGLEAGSSHSQIALDAVGRKIYWMYHSKLRHANLDGTTIEDISKWNRENEIIDIALDVMNRKIYWGRSNGKIQRANLDGTNMEDIVTILGVPGDMALDAANRKIYWREHYWKRGDRFFSIRRSNLDGKNVHNIVTDVSGLITDIALSISPLAANVVSIPDANLAAAVRKALDLRENAPITRQLIQKLTELDASDSQIKNLTGLEHATRLRLLEVRRNQIRDIRPLTKLKNLKKLILEQNAVRDISPVANMTELRWLLLGGNPISDFTPLANLNQLEGLGLWGGNIGDVTLLANKTKLTHLWVARNNISNIAPLANLTQLKVLELRDNRIRNINPLVGLKKLEALSLSGNPIQDLSPLRTLLKQNPKLELDIRPDAGPKIEGPWVWMIAPTDGKGPKAAGSGKDWLAAASGGSVTEKQIATNGATPGTAVGNKVWTSGKIAPTGGNNIAEMVNAIGLGTGNYIEYHVAYGSLSLYSPRKQNTKMYVGSDESVKVWLNGVLVHNNPADRGAGDYQDTFSVTLKQGRNIVLVAVYNGRWHWSGFFGFENDAVYSLAPTSVVHIGATERPPLYWIDAKTGTLHRLIGDTVENLAPTVKNGTEIAVDAANSKLYWTEKTGDRTGRIRGANLDGSNVRILTRLQSVPTSIAVDAANSKLYWTNAHGRIQAMNVNGGTITNLIQNLKEPNTITLDAAASMLYWGGPDSIWRADLNGNNREAFAPNLGELRSIAIAGDRIYSIERPTGEQHYQIRSSTLNGLTPAQTLATLQSKPLGLAVDTTGGKLYWTDAAGKIQRANLNGGNIQNVVTGLHTLGDIVLGIPISTNPAAPGIAALVTHQLPVETQLLANYPNPFNPETWIPYRLATNTDVRILIYDARGSIVRHLGLGHQPAGTYTDKRQAAYWDGRNTLGEPVASGLYFYQLQTDTVSLLRKMLILR